MCFPGSSIVLSVLAGEDSGNVLSGHAMQMEMKLGGQFGQPFAG
jgi:hypothetical protein